MSQKYWLTLFLVAGIIAGPAVAQSLVPIDPATVTDGHVYLMDNVGANLPDVSANSNNGNLIGSPQTVPGLNGEALQFNGTSDGVHLPDAATINTSIHQNKTVIAVFNCADVTKTSKQIVYEEGGSTRGLTIYVHEGLAYAGAWNRGDYTPNFLGTWLGVEIQDYSEGGLTGARIASMTSESPAKASGLQVGDVILAVDQQPVTSRDLPQRIKPLEPGQTIQVDILRNGTRSTQKVTIGSVEGYLTGLPILAPVLKVRPIPPAPVEEQVVATVKAETQKETQKTEAPVVPAPTPPVETAPVVAVRNAGADQTPIDEPRCSSRI